MKECSAFCMFMLLASIMTFLLAQTLVAWSATNVAGLKVDMAMYADSIKGLQMTSAVCAILAFLNYYYHTDNKMKMVMPLY